MLRQVVILVGGLGSRLGNLTHQTPKPMLLVAGEPFLNILIRNFARHGISKVTLLASHCADQITTYYRQHPVPGVSIQVVTELERLGTAGALKNAARHLDDMFLLANGDSIFDFNYLELLEQMENKSCQINLALREVEECSRYGQVTTNDAGLISGFFEKLATAEGPGYINGGVYLLRRTVLDHIGVGVCSLETDVLPRLVAKGKVRGGKYHGYFIDIGIPESYAQANQDFPTQSRRPAIFFDRDGTLNLDAGYTHRPEDLTWVPGAVEAIKRCNDAGCLVIVITNQAGIARGYYSPDDVNVFHSEMQQQLQPHGAHIDSFYFCPHHIDGSVAQYAISCDCRKPKTGLLKQACRDWDIDLESSAMVGDKLTDIIAAENFGIKSYLHEDKNLLHTMRNVSF